MSCPIFAQSEECFCLHENCRYYDVNIQKCIYWNTNINKQQPTDSSLSDDINLEQAEKMNKTEEPRPVQIEKRVKMSAKELWDSLSIFHHENGIPRYDELIKDLIKVVSITNNTHYLTKKDLDFWYQKIEGLESYRNLLENYEKLEQ